MIKSFPFVGKQFLPKKPRRDEGVISEFSQQEERNHKVRDSLDPPAPAEAALPQTRHGESAPEALSRHGLLLLGMLGADMPPQLLKEVQLPSFFPHTA